MAPGLCIATVAAATATTVGTAYADVLAQVYISSGQLLFLDKPGVNSINLTVRTAGSAVQFDAQYTISPLFGCYYPVATDTTKVNCAGTITSLFISAGDGGRASSMWTWSVPRHSQIRRAACARRTDR